jgi:Glycosyl transferases group 1
VKVLYIDHPEADVLSAIVFMGLCQELGAENVVDWPWKHTFHGQVYEGPIPYDPPGSRGVCAPFQWMTAQGGRPWSDDEVFARICEFDLVVLASPRAYDVADLDRLIARVGRHSLKRLVHVDGEDYTAVRWDLVERFKPSVYFKLSLTEHPVDGYAAFKASASAVVRLVPCPLASSLEIQPVAKDIDVVFLGGGNWQPRRVENVPAVGPPAKPALDERLAREFGSFAGGYRGYADFITTINRAKIAISVGGSGMEPMRTYEILSCPGTLLARERIQVITPYPFIDGVNHVAFDGTSHDDIVRVLRQYLADEPARSRVAAAGNTLLKTHYTPRARARQILEEAFR